MYTHRFVSTQHRCRPDLLFMALALSLALGALPLAQAGQLGSAAPVKAGSDKAAQHSIIFVGGRTQGDARRARAHPPGPCAPQTGSHSSCNDRSLNPQPIPPGHRNYRSTDESLTHTPTHPRLHKPVANPHKGD